MASTRRRSGPSRRPSSEYVAWSHCRTFLPDSLPVNCAGTNHRTAAPFVSDGPQLSSAIIAVNTTATVRMTSLSLPGMLARRKPALVLNMASHAGGLMPAPLHATYSGSKAFIVSSTQALGVELRKSGSLVDVAAINLGTVVRPTHSANSHVFKKVVQAPGLFQDFGHPLRFRPRSASRAAYWRAWVQAARSDERSS